MLLFFLFSFPVFFLTGELFGTLEISHVISVEWSKPSERNMEIYKVLLCTGLRTTRFGLPSLLPFLTPGSHVNLLGLSHLFCYITMCLWNPEGSGLCHAEEDEKKQQGVKVWSRKQRKSLKALTLRWCRPLILAYLCFLLLCFFWMAFSLGVVSQPGLPPAHTVHSSGWLSMGNNSHP